MTFVLDAFGNPVPEPDVLKWADWMFGDVATRQVKKETVGDTTVSTVFLGIDHGLNDDAPVLWETMTFGALQEICERCTGNRESALKMHEEVKSKLLS